VIHDARRAPFCFQTHAALDVIRERFVGAKRTTAIAVYVAMTETANRNGGSVARESFRASRKEIADRAGVSVDTLDRYAADLAEAGLIEVERERVGTVNLPNRWSLVEPPVRTGAPPSRTGAATPSRTDAATPSRTGAARTTRKDLEERSEETPLEGRVPRTVNQKPTTDIERQLAAAVLAEWNEQAGQKLAASEWLGKIVMRIREYPDLGPDDHAHVIAASLAKPWWKGPASPSVVYGSGAQFERSILAVTAPAPESNGEPLRYGRGLTARQMRDMAESGAIRAAVERINRT